MNSQVHIYGVETNAFYTDAEVQIDKRLSKLRNVKWKHKNTDMEGGEKLDIKQVNADIRGLKEELKAEFASNMNMRTLRSEYLNDKSIISIFESNLTRTLGMQPQQLSDAMIIVRVYYFDVFKDIVLNGFDINGEHYVFFSASAGQIRTKKAVFIKESLMEKHSLTLMCGLTVDEINKRGGCNTNKYLAYLALCNTATEPWHGFNIDKAIVVNDMELAVGGEVDFIDDKTYEIKRQVMDIPIEHTDGCGMILPSLTGGKNMMVRLPWIKGLLAAFPFDYFINKHGGGKVTDIYGVEHDVIAEGIEVIFSKSQFKMHNFFDNFEKYRENFKKYNCAAGICNVEPDEIGNATLNYQMLQTLSDITDDELSVLSQKTNYRLKNLASDRKVMLKTFGADAGNENIRPDQECLRLYPELLQDPYFKTKLRDLKKALEKDAWSGKLDVYGKYSFVIPDMYAFCEWLFLGEKHPKGLLGDGEVYCALFPYANKLDCLRSPHLYCEHAVRKNIAHERPEYAEWFTERAIYISCHDAISRILQLDWDGDKLLVCAEKTLIEVAERNMRDVVPLYYEMKKAGSHEVSRQSSYEGMVTAYRSGNIGTISNNITKIWNSPEIDLDAVKLLCMQTNYVIDYAKTLYKPTPPPDIDARLKQYAKEKLPQFFVYAKGKKKSQVLERNESCIHRLQKIIPKRRFKFSGKHLGKFDYRMLMDNPLLIKTPHVEDTIKKFSELASKVRVQSYEDKEECNKHNYCFQKIRDEMFADGHNHKYIVDAIIVGIFGERKSRRKVVFWRTFGDIILENLKKNLAEQCSDKILCRKCTSRFEAIDRNLRCPSCGAHNGRMKEIVCECCGQPFLANARGYKKKICDSCYDVKRRKYIAKKTSQYRRN